jgi:AcrR family transcriptional regulator
MPRSSTTYHHGDLRNALLEEAARLVETDGVDALTLRELARRLDVSHAAPGHHFADKAALLAELAADGFEELTRELESGLREGRSPATQLRDVGRGYLRFALRRPGHYRVMFGRETRSENPLPRLAAAGTRAFEVLQQAVKAALSPAHARSAQKVSQAAFVAWSSTHGAAMLLLDAPHVLALPQAGGAATVKALVEHVTSSVANAIAHSPEG